LEDGSCLANRVIGTSGDRVIENQEIAMLIVSTQIKLTSARHHAGSLAGRDE
jgi:hypothetical protein